VQKFRLRISYDGTDYFGFQSQPGKPTVQARIEEAIWRFTGERIRIGYAGRTDTGVHAMGQVVSFTTEIRLSEPQVLTAMNANLPDEIVVWEAREVPEDFDPRRSAVSRAYRYIIENQIWPTPFNRRFSWHVRDKLDIEAMRAGASELVGRVDLACFTEKSGERVQSTVRNVLRSEVQRDDGIVSFEIEANSFLPHVVRNIVGTLVWVGRGRLNSNEIRGIVGSRDRKTAGPAAPGRGLFLVRVKYPDDEDDEISATARQ